MTPEPMISMTTDSPGVWVGAWQVVTHSAFLLSLFTQVLHCEDALRVWFENAEMRPVTLHFPA
jgi:hypothetical protein